MAVLSSIKGVKTFFYLHIFYNHPLQVGAVMFCGITCFKHGCTEKEYVILSGLYTEMNKTNINTKHEINTYQS